MQSSPLAGGDDGKAISQNSYGGREREGRGHLGSCHFVIAGGWDALLNSRHSRRHCVQPLGTCESEISATSHRTAVMKVTPQLAALQSCPGSGSEDCVLTVDLGKLIIAS